MILEFESLVNKYRVKISGISHFGAHLGQEVKDYKKSG